MKNIIKFASVAAFLGLLLAAKPAMAATPSLSLYSSGGDNVTITINNADPNSSIRLNYTQPGSSLVTSISNFGYTNSSGYYSSGISVSAYGIGSGSQVYVTVNGQQSNYTNINGSGCGYNGYSCGSGLTLSQTSVSLNQGQTSTVYISGSYYSSSYYISSNSNSSAVSASISGSTLSLYGLSSGSSTVSVCSGTYGSSCANVYVTVSGSTVGGFTLNPTNVSVNVGQTATVTASFPYIYSGNLYLGSNSNSGVATASFSGSNIYVYGQSAGTTTMGICYGTSCVNLYVTVSDSGTSGNISFSQNNLSMNAGQSQSVTIYNNGGSYYSSSYYISSNSDSSVASASVSGNVLTVSAFSSGSTTFSVCQSGSGCGWLYVKVSGTSSGTLSLSQTNLNLNVGQNTTVYAYNVSSVYISSNSNPSVVSASVYSQNQISLNGLSSGSATVYVCANGSSYQCATVYVSVYGSSSNLTFSQNNLTLVTGQSANVYVYSTNPNSGAFYVSSQTNYNVATVNFSGNNMTIFGQNGGYASISVCQYGSSSCSTVNVTVNGGSSSGSVWFNVNNPTVSAGQTQVINVSSGYSNPTYYISSNSNSYVATASVSGGVLTLYGQNTGNTTVTICVNNGGCGTLYVTVSGGSYGYGLTFANPSLPTGTAGQYYSQQLSVSGGSSPYTFVVQSGSLPGGLTLSSSGQIFGTPTAAQTSYFTVQAQDAYGRVASQPITLVINGSVLGATSYKSGTLMIENGTVYIIYKNTKTGFASRSVFEGLGFNFGQVVTSSYSGIPDSGYIVRSSKNAHPWGAWIKSGSTVYFVHDSGLIPVSDYSTFINNGGEDRLVVPANSYDFRLPMLSVMTYNDPRLR